MTSTGQPRIFVTGGSGLLGWTLTRFLTPASTLFQYWQHPLPDPLHTVKVDLVRRDDLMAVLNRYRPDIIINTAALTDQTFCEKYPQAAKALNSHVPGWLAVWAQENGARLVHISTDLVFDGTLGHYRESDPPNPVSVYGQTKLTGEQQVLEACDQGVVLRISIMGGTSFTGQRSLNEVIPQQVSENGSVRLFTDEMRSAIWADNVAEVILELIDHDFTGLLHVPGGKDYSRYEIGEMVFRYYGLSLDKLKPARIADFSGTPPRCPDVTTNGSLLQNTLTTPLHDFAAGFQLYLPVKP